MAEKVCCPGPIGGNNGNSAGGFREAVCVHTKKVYDSCRSKECLRDIRVYLTRDAQELINAGGIASVKPREAELLCVSIDVERIQFNRGFYSVDIRFFYRIECEISCVIGRPRIVDGLAVFDKRVVLFGGEGGARIVAQKVPHRLMRDFLLVQFLGSETSLSTRCPRQPSCLQACRRPDRYLRCAPARTACSGSAYRSLP